MYLSYRRQRATWSGWEVRLAESYLVHGTEMDRRGLVTFLDELKTEEADGVLMRLGKTAEVEVDDDPRRDTGWAKASSAEITALRLLAQRRVVGAKQVINEKLADAPEGKDRLMLEIARACYDAAPVIRKEYLACESDGGDVAELAWKLYSESPDKREDIEMLAAAARSPSYEVQNQAAARLAAYGLTVLKPKAQEFSERLADWGRQPAVQVIEKCSELLKQEKDFEKEKGLHVRRGQAYLETGDYAAARKDLQYAGDEEAFARAMAAHALGRYGEAMDALHRSTSKGRNLEKLLMLRACVRYSMGEFREALDDATAAAVLGLSEDVLPFRHLTLMQLRRVDQSPLNEWEPLVDSDGAPLYENQVIRFLQGKISPNKLLKAVEEDRDVNPSGFSEANWVLSQLARMKGGAGGERRFLEQAVAAGAFESHWHVLALRRLVELDELAGRPGG